jgi:F0F1-type ATP synthase delta subunit
MKSVDSVVVRSAFPLPDEFKKDIERTLTGLLSKQEPPGITLSFICVPQLMAGLELSVGGWKLAWSISEHLKNLQVRLNQVIQLAPPKPNRESEPVGAQTKATCD